MRFVNCGLVLLERTKLQIEVLVQLFQKLMGCGAKPHTYFIYKSAGRRAKSCRGQVFVRGKPRQGFPRLTLLFVLLISLRKYLIKSLGPPHEKRVAGLALPNKQQLLQRHHQIGNSGLFLN